MRKLLLLASMIVVGFTGYSQDTLTTLPTFINNNGSSAISFEIIATQAIKITGLSNIWNNGVATTDIWTRPGAINGSGSIQVNTANGWSQHQTGVTINGANGTTPAWVSGMTPITVAAGDTLGIVITGSMRYYTATNAPTTTFPGQFATLAAGSLSNGFGGVVPNLTNDPRGFLGHVVVEQDLLGNCSPYTDVRDSNLTATTATIKWTPGTGNTSFWVEYGAPGFTPGTGTKVTGTYPGVQPPVILTGLSVNTDYEYYIGEICNNGVDSVYNVSPYAFKTTKLCAPVSNFMASNVLATSVDLSWVHPGGANSYTIYYGAGQSVSTTSSPYTLTGLTSNTSYDIYIVADCGAVNGMSDSIGPVSILTPCTIFTAPFAENFDGASWVASGNNNNNAVDPCWTSTPNTSASAVFKWIPRSTGPTSGNGPTSDYTGTNFMYCEASGSSSGNTADLISPIIDASGLTTPALYFHQHRYSNATIADMQVEVSNDLGATWDTVYSVTGDIQTSASDAWSLEYVNLAAYTGDTIMVKFRQMGNGCCGDAAIDNVEIKEAPTCPWPTNITVNFITSTSAVVTWTDPSGSSWDIEWGPQGFQQGTGAIKTTSTNPDTLTGLSSNTWYDVYVRTNCVSSGNGTSIWTGPIAFKTLCSPFTAPYFNDFSSDVANQIPNCFNKIQTYGTGNFQATVETEAFGTPYSTPNHLGLYNWWQFTAADVLAAVTPAFSDMSVGDKRINFFAKSTWAGNRLIVGTTADGVTINVIDTITFGTANNYQQYFIDLTVANGYNGTDNQVVFQFDLSNLTNTFDYIYIDDFTYEQILACNPPIITTLGANAGITSAQLFWGSSQGDSTDVQWGIGDFIQGTGVLVGGTRVGGATDTVT
ncbi:MAG: hypothetical protein N4A46_02810, partial [Schleiferiaceae bacterium]|nr:hypothetical protein [Schleiferiaceae bacterium]